MVLGHIQFRLLDSISFHNYKLLILVKHKTIELCSVMNVIAGRTPMGIQQMLDKSRDNSLFCQKRSIMENVADDNVAENVD